MPDAIGFPGLGNLGRPIVGNLMAAGAKARLVTVLRGSEKAPGA